MNTASDTDSANDEELERIREAVLGADVKAPAPNFTAKPK